MCELFAMSSRVATTVTFSLEEFSQHGGGTAPHGDGWGLAYFDGVTAQLIKEPHPAALSQRMHQLQTAGRRSSCVISHIRHATVGVRSLDNTQPFVKEISGRSHVFAHNGHLGNIQTILGLDRYTLRGETDSEYAFCYLMEAIEPLWDSNTPALQQRVGVVKKIFDELAPMGPANFIYSDGDYLYAFANKRTQANGLIEPPGMYYLPRHCICDRETLKKAGVDIACDPQDIVLFASVPLTNEQWLPVEPCELMIARLGDLRET